ncbi:MAG: orotate phosphoribosyltransferase [Firmicutes bacterium CAG:137_57_8]|nr:MAG: orotate phosphoribosyltransferase [Firmicutes bacterium CAG:137_57_8]
MLNLAKLPVRKSNVALRVSKGHFATNHSHINYLIDVTFQKSRLSEAQAVAKALVKQYVTSTIVDTIVCLDGMQVVGPELSSESQLLFRENLQPMLAGKHVLILMASVTTGLTISQSMECVRYYGGKVVGVSAIYSATDVAADGTRINALFHLWDLPDYASYHAQDCPLCRQGIKIDAVVTGNGYSSL